MSPASLKKTPSIGTNDTVPQQSNAGDSADSKRPSSESSRDISEEKDRADETTSSKDLENGNKSQQAEKPFVFKGKKMLGVMVALALSMFLAALDNTIVSTMLPKITEQFNALTLMSWIISAYVVSSTALQPIYGKLSQIYGHQYVILVAHGFFLIGSIICGASKSANMLIAGRAIAGIGGSGLMSLCFVVVGDFVPTAKTPIYMSIFSMVWAVASVVGPLLGGVFAEKTGFKWGFYINPCIQAVVLVLIVLFMRLPRPQGSAIEKLKRIDFIGTAIVVVGMVLLQLGLVWGGQEYPWKSAAVIVSLILGIVFLFLFVIVEWKLPTEPIMPMRLFKSRNACFILVSQLTFGIVFFLALFYFPLYLSVVRNASAINSGLHLISCVLSIALASIAAGVFIGKTGIYMPVLRFGVAVTTVGIGLFALLGTSPSNGMLIGIPIVFGAGIGFSMQPMIVCIQNSVEQQDVATVTTLFMTLRMMGSAIGLAIAQSILQNQMAPRLAKLTAQYPDQTATIEDMVHNQAAAWGPGVPVDVHNALIEAYVKSLHMVYFVFIAFAGITVVFSLFLKNAPLRKKLGDSANK